MSGQAFGLQLLEQDDHGLEALAELVAGRAVYVPQPDLLRLFERRGTLLSHDVEPDDLSLGMLALDWIHHHVAVIRDIKGDRVRTLISVFQRYILPFVIETEARFAIDRRVVASWRFADGTGFALMLAGRRENLLPAATVAGDLLGRTGLGAIWLTLTDAGAVSHGGAAAVRRAIEHGRVAVQRTPHGQKVLFAADLRRAGLLIEKGQTCRADFEEEAEDEPWGLARETAKRIIGDLKQVFHHAQNNGAQLKLAPERIRSSKTLDKDLMRAANPPRMYLFPEVVQLCEHLGPIHQLVLWIQRLAGLRVAEVFGLLVSDIAERDGRTWLSVTKQGGCLALVRDENGDLQQIEGKPDPKTKESNREIPACSPLAKLVHDAIAIFHTDPATGDVRLDARLVPGLRDEDSGGMQAYMDALRAAGEAAGIDTESVMSHDFRRSLTTDLRGAGIDDRIAEPYFGHLIGRRQGPTVHDGYDLGPSPAELCLVADAVDRIVVREIGDIDLRIPTSKRHSFGTGRTEADHWRAALRDCGWQLARGTQAVGIAGPAPSVSVAAACEPEPCGELLDVQGVASALGIAVVTARKQMREGKIPAHQVKWGARLVWVAYASDVEGVQAARESGITIDDLALELGWTYHHVWTVVRGGRANGKTGARILLTDAEADAVRTVAAAQDAVLDTQVTRRQAAETLQLPASSMQTLARRGAFPGETTSARTGNVQIPVAEVTGFAAKNPTQPRPKGADRAIPVKRAQLALGITRSDMTDLVTSRRLRATEINRRQHVSLSTLTEYASGRPAMTDGVLALAAEDWPEYP